MTVIDQIFYKVAEIAIPHFFITVEFSASGTEMPEHIEAFLQEKYEVVDERYALKNKVQMINKVQMKSKS